MDEDNLDLYIGSELFSILSSITCLKPLALTEKAKITLDCLYALTKTLTDSDFPSESRTEGSDE
jgi:hypothetical protein